MSRRRPSGLKTVIRSITVIITEISSVKYGEHGQHALLNKAQIKQWQKVDYLRRQIQRNGRMSMSRRVLSAVSFKIQSFSQLS